MLSSSPGKSLTYDSVRFNDNPLYFGTQLTGGNLGTYSAMQNLPRRMQFGLRYDF